MEQMQDICRGSVGPLPLDGANSRKCLIIVDRQAEHVAFFSQSFFIFYEFMMMPMIIFGRY
jgi:hypothetical protein